MFNDVIEKDFRALLIVFFLFSSKNILYLQKK